MLELVRDPEIIGNSKGATRFEPSTRGKLVRLDVAGRTWGPVVFDTRTEVFDFREGYAPGKFDFAGRTVLDLGRDRIIVQVCISRAAFLVFCV